MGNYDPATNTPSNQCHRSPDSAIHRTGIPADLTFNAACSGGYTGNIRIGGSKQYADELVQSDSLAIKARNTRIKMVLLVAGANDDLQFGPVMTDCVTRWVLSQGTCEPKYAPGWQGRVDGLRPKVEATLADLKTVMRDAGYADADYKLVVMGYPSPIGPDFNDNPNFPGKLPGGCAGYDSDATWGRNQAVPAFEKGMRAAARNAGALYLDNSRLFHGHEVCMEDTWARGLYLDLGDHFPWDENTARQSFHPNYRGHGAFASCLTQFYNSGLTEASCADPASTGSPVLQTGAWDDLFKPLRNEATGSCLDANGGASANNTAVIGWDCHGGRNQGWWYDTARKSVRTELTHDRCLDVPASNHSAGTALILWNCHGGANQQFVRDGATLRPAAAPPCASPWRGEGPPPPPALHRRRQPALRLTPSLPPPAPPPNPHSPGRPPAGRRAFRPRLAESLRAPNTNAALGTVPGPADPDGKVAWASRSNPGCACCRPRAQQKVEGDCRAPKARSATPEEGAGQGFGAA